MASGAIAVLAREGRDLPPDTGVDQHGQITRKVNELSALLPFGRHKGYGLSLLDELYAAFIGGSLPTLRNRWPGADVLRPFHDLQPALGGTREAVRALGQ